MILYFSATGNSKYVATRLVQSEEQEMLSIVDCIRNGQYVFVKQSESYHPPMIGGCRV